MVLLILRVTLMGLSPLGGLGLIQPMEIIAREWHLAHHPTTTLCPPHPPSTHRHEGSCCKCSLLSPGLASWGRGGPSVVQ